MHVRFSYQALTAGRYEVGIAGDFTHWKILSLQDFGGLYLIDFDLKPGRYSYKYIIDGVWRTDPSNSLQEADPYGGSNSIIAVEEEKAPQNWDEALNAAAKQDARSFINAFRPAVAALELRFSWYAGLADEIWFEFSDAKLPMFPLGRNSGLMIWHRQIQIRQARRFHVCIRHREKTVYMGMEGFVQRKKDATPLVVDPSSWRVFEIPQWLKSSVVYQIFPDRFCNGNPDNDQDFSESYYQASNIKPKPGEILGPNREYFHLVKDWSDISTLKQSPWQEEGIPDWHSFYGGDIEGVVQKLDYLVDTGINLIYFNPLWEAKSNHKYDAAHFKRIDPHFGNEQELKKLVLLAHQKGIRIILDVAFNHSGEAFWAFRDTVEKGPDSPYWHWYDWHKWPLPDPLPPDFQPREYYQCWWGIKDMPDLNYDLSRQHPYENYIRDINNAEVNWDLVNHILDAASWWISDIGMDGFRLDVPDEVPWWFWQLFRERIKGLKPDAWLVGEIWNNARAWIAEQYFDSVMNYAYFKNPVLEFFVQKLCSAKEFKLKIEEGLTAYPAHASRVMMNLLGSHDTLRIRHLAKDNITALKQAIFFQMTFVGIPHIYYGDEIYMDGAKDPDNRRPFNWAWQEDPKAIEMREFYKATIRLRKEHRLLREGEFCFTKSCSRMLVYRRYDEDECLYCGINLANEDKLMPVNGEIVFGYKTPHRSTEGILLPPGAMCVLREKPRTRGKA